MAHGVHSPVRMLKAIFAASLVTACTSSDIPTGSTDLSGGGIVENSAFSGTLGVDNGSNTTLGWTVSFTRVLPGANCFDVQLDADATLSIITDQVETPDHPTATLTPGDIAISSDLDAPGAVHATIQATGLLITAGTATITAFSVDDIQGSLIATGTDLDGNAVQLSGTFDAPSCGH